MARGERRSTAVGSRQAVDTATLERHFGVRGGLVPLWIAEPDLPLAPPIVEALSHRAATAWYGYETRPEQLFDAFWNWMYTRHGWDGSGLETLVSPSVGTTLGVLIEQWTSPGDGVVIQPPVFTDFKPLITRAGRRLVRNELMLTETGYRMDVEDLANRVRDPGTRMLIVANPHNPVGRVWRADELRRVAEICAEHGVVVVADEIHADIVMPSHRFHPFALAAADLDLTWAATHGPAKTFGLAGVCDTLLVTRDAQLADRFRAASSRLHLTRNNVFALAAFDAAYRHAAQWVDDLLGLVHHNNQLLRAGLPDTIHARGHEGTYLAWLDLRQLGLDVANTPRWLAESTGLALSPGHWFGRAGAGFARMTIAVPSDTVTLATERLTEAAERAAEQR